MVKRLTHERAFGLVRNKNGKYYSPFNKQELIDRLAAYEDLGYSPEELAEMINKMKEQKRDENHSI